MTLAGILLIGIGSFEVLEEEGCGTTGIWDPTRRGCGGSCREEIPANLLEFLPVVTSELSVTGVDPKLGLNVDGELSGVTNLRPDPLELVSRPLVVASLAFFPLTDNT